MRAHLDGRMSRCASAHAPPGWTGFSSDGATVTKFQFTPLLVFAPDAPSDRVIAIASGADHVLLLSADGRVRSFGCAEKGRLGRLPEADADAAIGDAPEEQRPAMVQRVTTPALVPGLPPMASIAAVRRWNAPAADALRCLR